ITELPIQHACEMVQRHLPFLIGHQEVFELLELNAPGAARQVAQDFPRLTALVLVVRAILSEYGSIAHLEQIYDVFVRLFDTETPIHEIFERVRMIPALRNSLNGSDYAFNYFYISQSFKLFLDSSITRTAPHPFLAIKPKLPQGAPPVTRKFAKI